jgi:WD40 repeat protein/uncharacterized caspase-like protein
MRLIKSLFFLLLVIIGNIVSAQQPKLMLPIGHTKNITMAEFSPDGKSIVTASSDNTAKIWDVASGYLLLELKGHTNEVSSAHYSPDGKKILTASNDSTAKIWNAETGKLLIEIKDSINGIRSAQFSPDGNKIVAPTMGITARIWDANTGKFLTELIGHKFVVWGAQFSPDGKTVVTNSTDNTAKIWDANTGKLITDLTGHTDMVSSAQFSPDGKKLVTSSGDKTAIVWDLISGNPLLKLTGHKDFITTARFSSDGKKIVTASIDNIAKVWDATTGKFFTDLTGHTNRIISASFSPDGTTILTASDDKTARVWNAENGIQLFDLKGHTAEISSAQFSPDGKKIVTASSDKTSRIWDAATGKLLSISSGHTELTSSIQFSPDNKKIITYSDGHPGLIWDANTGKLLPGTNWNNASPSIIQYSPDGKKAAVLTKKMVSLSKTEDVEIEEIKIWDIATGKPVAELKGDELIHLMLLFSPDGKKIITVSGDNSPKLWDAGTGRRLAELKGHFMSLSSIQFSPDGKKILTASNDISAKIWDAQTGKLLKDLTDFNGGLYSAEFSSDGKKIITAAYRSTPRVWDAITGKILHDLKGHTGEVTSAQFSPDGKKAVTTSEDSTLKTWDAASGKLLATCVGNGNVAGTVQFSPDSKKILSSSFVEKNALIWDATTGKLINELKGHNDFISNAIFSPDGKSIATISHDNTIKKWDAATGKCLYTFFAVDKDDYLITDNDNHYDGTEAARKLLYFVCGTEIVSIEQVKDQLWVPDLAERINKGETINAKSLNDLNICGLTPLVQEKMGNPDEYYFTIKSRRGGLGDITLSVNGAITDTKKPEQLPLKDSVYELRILKNEFNSYLQEGQMNSISLKAYTTDNSISSREITITIDKTAKPAPPPNLYGVMVGINDYKGDKLDLNYAAIDAKDISTAVADAAVKLLGKEHVFMYNLTTGKDYYRFPEKKGIKEVFEEIGKKATANDILFIFFSGHGVMKGEEKKVFYYMTADASDFDQYADAGISTAELTEWIKPQNIKAQKRILILDACHSGQVINDFVKIGDEGQGFLASKGDDNAEQVKAIDKLNERSGLFILSASASNKLAFESPVLSHGYLSYSLLKTIKQQPDILEDGKYLNISRWFNATGKTLDEIAKEDGETQETQIVTNTDFNIGLVDDEVTGKIKLAEERQLFSASNFQNSDVIISDDDLDLGKQINTQLISNSSKGTESKILFLPASRSPEAYRLSGRYIVKGNSIIVSVNIRQNKILKSKFALSGTIDKLEELAANIVKKAVEWVEANKKH